MSRDGVDLFVKHQTIAAAIDSFLKYTETLRDEEAKFYVYLLETFSYFLQYAAVYNRNVLIMIIFPADSTVESNFSLARVF